MEEHNEYAVNFIKATKLIKVTSERTNQSDLRMEESGSHSIFSLRVKSFTC